MKNNNYYTNLNEKYAGFHENVSRNSLSDQELANTLHQFYIENVAPTVHPTTHVPAWIDSMYWAMNASQIISSCLTLGNFACNTWHWFNTPVE